MVELEPCAGASHIWYPSGNSTLLKNGCIGELEFRAIHVTSCDISVAYGPDASDGRILVVP